MKNKPCFVPGVLRLRWNANLFICGVTDEIYDAVANFQARVGAKSDILRHVPVALLTVVVKVFWLMRTRALCRHGGVV